MQESEAKYKTLREYLNTTGISQIELARQMGMDQAQLSNYMTSRRIPGRVNGVRIWNACDRQVELIDILTGDAFFDYL